MFRCLLGRARWRTPGPRAPPTRPTASVLSSRQDSPCRWGRRYPKARSVGSFLPRMFVQRPKKPVPIGSARMAEIKNVGVVGCGQMGHGIAQVTATAGYAVVVREVDDATLNKGLGKIEKQLARAVERGKSSQEDADAIRGRLHGTTDYGELADCDLVVEAITESLELKRQMWKEVTTIVK